jgi:hypothetical protein
MSLSGRDQDSIGDTGGAPDRLGVLYPQARGGD